MLQGFLRDLTEVSVEVRTDRGRLYAPENYRELLNQHKMIPSMNRKGNCYDNAVAESFLVI